MAALRGDLRLALDRAEFARAVGLEPDAWQEKLLRSSSDRVLLNCCRQSGKSTMAALIGLHRAIYHPGSLILILAPAERQAKETFAKVAEMYASASPGGASRAISPESYRKLGMEFSNRSRIEALPGTEKTIRGFSGTALLILDEAARVADELYFAVRPMLAISGGALMMLTTPYGKRGVFYDEWTRGYGWDRYEVSAYQVPRIPSSFLGEERRSMPRWWYRQEYECSFEETEDQIFTHEMTSAARDDSIAEHRFEGDESLWD